MLEHEDDATKVPNRARFAERYELHDVLGRGGMAVVYRATDLGNGKTVALKQLTRPESDAQRAHVEALFEREFHALAQLKHPCVIEVYDYGVTPDGVCFYTMELLDGGTLRERAPIPWRETCRLLFDVCSSLALLHSRRLLHRDVSPRNVHCTRDNRAKLIDFGAVAPMMANGPIVGTPAFTAPEIAQRSTADARADLYAVGATLYYALTGALAYPVRDFADLLTLRNVRPTAPSTRVHDIPRALDELVMSLLSFEPEMRPTSAFAVMQRLAAIAELEMREDEGVSRAYLVTPSLVGRDALLATLRQRLQRGLWTGDRALMLLGPSGIGRSRLLDACVLEAKTLGARVLRASARGKSRALETVYALTLHLLETYPSDQLVQQFPRLFEPMDLLTAPRLRPLAQLAASPELLEQSFLPLLRAASKSQPLVIAVDDAHAVDERSAALLALLIEHFRYGRAVVLLTAEPDAQLQSQVLAALEHRSDSFVLEPLNEDDTKSLFSSVFGEVPNLGRVAEEIFSIARGNPADSMRLAQHLIDRGTITYSAGVWTLPAAVSRHDLPQSAEESVQARIAKLSGLARFLAQAHALSFSEHLTLDDYRLFAPTREPGAVDAALTELLSQQALISDGERYLLANRLWAGALERSLVEQTRTQAHRALAALFRTRVPYGWIYHALAGKSASEEGAAVDALLAKYEQSGRGDHNYVQDGNFEKLASVYPYALQVASRLGRPARQLHELRRGLVGTSIAAGEPKYYKMVASELLDQLIHDTGLADYRADNANPDPGARLTSALTAAFVRHQADPEERRGFRPDEAIPILSEYVAISIAIGVRTMDYALLRTLPGLLEPFAPLSPLIDALWQNALGCCEAHVYCRYEAARARWIEVIAKLREVSGAEVRHVVAIRNAIQYAVGSVEAVFGLPDAARWVEGLDDDPYQRVSALYVRKIVRLEQGDWPGANHLQRSAELLALRNRVPQMFSATLPIELTVRALARDVAGVKDIVERERAEAAQYPGWIPYLRTAEAYYELVRGDLLKAKAAFQHVLELTALDENLESACMPMWFNANAGLFETLLALDCPAEVQVRAEAALAACEKLNIVVFKSELIRLLALAEAQLGAIATANERLDRLIEAQLELGVTGVRLGIGYEARATIALLNDDVAAFEKFARLTAHEYRHGAGCPLGARYEHLMRDARGRGIQLAIALTDFELTTTAETRFTSLDELRAAVEEALGAAKNQEERYRHALRLVCSARAAKGGHLYTPAPDAPQLVATCDLPEPSARLHDHVRDLLETEQDRFETKTIALEHISADRASTPIVHEDGVDYELLMLTYFTAEEAQVAGVIALAPGDRGSTHPLQAQLLATIAEQLCAEETTATPR